ncbi:MAG: hypothetical protein DWP92_08700 [Armatimonadetes bacterium]|nr:MAG: hypothetical protein DWP92_08700 [Armatimonadota bacterium]
MGAFVRLVVDARTSAFAAFLDYGGVFPPTSLGVGDAVAKYRDARRSEFSWVGGRFLVRASQLEELAAVAMATMVAGEAPWEVSVIFDLDPAQSADLAAAFHAEMEPAMTVSAVEARIVDPTIDGIERLFTTVGSINPDVFGFLEVTPSANIQGQVGAIATVVKRSSRAGGAGLRCGGGSADLFPTADEVAAFIQSTVDAGLPYKVTGGLFRPVRGFDEALRVYRHGFLNLLMATAVAADGAGLGTIIEIVSETDQTTFGVSPAFATWRDIAIPGSALRRIRQNLFIAHTSNDFDQSIRALQEMNLLGEGQ